MDGQIEGLIAGYLSTLALIGFVLALGASRQGHAKGDEAGAQHAEGITGIRAGSEDAQRCDAKDQRAEHRGGACGSEVDGDVS
jgi:hypothetical protein